MDADPTATTRAVDGSHATGRGAIVIVEGLDGTGKTKLCTELYKTLSAPVALFHAGPPVVTTAIREYVWPLGVAAAGYTVICDRWHLGETVWPSVFNRESLIPTMQDLRDIEEQMLYLRTPVLALYMNRPFVDIRHELESRGEKADHLGLANALYSASMTKSRFDWHNTTLDKAHDIVWTWLDER